MYGTERALAEMNIERTPNAPTCTSLWAVKRQSYARWR